MVSRFLALNETDPKYLRDIILSFMIAGKLLLFPVEYCLSEEILRSLFKEKLAFRVSKVGAVLFELAECLLPVRVSKEALPFRLSKEVSLCTLPVRLSKEESFDSNQYKNHLCDFSLPYTP
ncbi:hypothetical protein V8G54_011202 [Vigna mungo]|uniref:Uncharacterized protein n=1 Tax=Vigna mungo TaxID=3915 RepID=A0AAQ3S2Q0_VIGMU